MSAYLFFAWRAWNQTLDAIENRDFETAQEYHQKCKLLAGFIDDFDVAADYIEAWILFEDEEYQEAAAQFALLPGVYDADQLARESEYNYAEQLFEDEQYQVAAELFAAMVEKHESGHEAEQMAIEAKYYYAVQLTEDALYDSAIDILWDLYQDHAYQPAYELWIENTYLWSLQKIEECDYKVAYDALNQISEEDERAEQELEELKPIIYEVGVAAYIAGEYKEARELLVCIGTDPNYSVAKYISLINYKTYGYNTGGIDLLTMIGFEDTNALIENSESLMIQYLYGTWENSSGYYYMSMEHKRDGTDYFSCIFPYYPDGEHFYIVDGIYKVGDSEASAKNYLSFTIVDEDTVNVYCYPTQSTYTLYRN